MSNQNIKPFLKIFTVKMFMYNFIILANIIDNVLKNIFFIKKIKRKKCIMSSFFKSIFCCLFINSLLFASDGKKAVWHFPIATALTKLIVQPKPLNQKTTPSLRKNISEEWTAVDEYGNISTIIAEPCIPEQTSHLAPCFDADDQHQTTDTIPHRRMSSELQQTISQRASEKRLKPITVPVVTEQPQSPYRQQYPQEKQDSYAYTTNPMKSPIANKPAQNFHLEQPTSLPEYKDRSLSYKIMYTCCPCNIDKNL